MIDADGWVDTFRHRNGLCVATEPHTEVLCGRRARAGSAFCQGCADSLDAVTPTLAYARTHRDEQVA